MIRHRLAGRAAILDATCEHPYARFAAGMAQGITGVAAEGALLWWGDGPLGRLGHGMGDPAALESLLAFLVPDC